MLIYPNVDLFATRFNHKLPLYVSPVQDNKAQAIDALSMDWNHLHAYAFPPFILIPAVLEKIRQHQCRIVLAAPFWPQQHWFSELLLLLVSAPIRLPLIPSLLTQSKGRFVHQNLPLLDLHAWELSNNQSEIKYFCKTLQILSPDQEEHLHKVYDAKWSIFSNWGHTKKVNLISAPITVIADFLIFLFLEKKCQISTIKGYRAMISNTLKFKTGNRIRSNPVLSELIRSFELQRPVQRSLILGFSMPTMDSQHLRFNQTDGSVSLMLKTGFLAKNQLPSVKPDPLVVPSLARICKREHLDRLLCPVRSLKFYLKMTSSYRQNRTRLFLPIKGNQDISKDTISKWISYTIKLAYRKLTK